MLRKKIVLTQMCILLFFGTVFTHAQNFKPFRMLHVIKTEHFDIIFPIESETTAHTLAGFADDVYNEITALLGINLYKRIPVVITPDTEQFNGYMAPVPYPHIVLYDTPMDLEWTSYENALKGLFLHELTHVISLSSRSPFFETLNRIFGGWVMPTALNASLFMVEGVTVSFESLNGFGRVNDPLIKQEIRQAIYENKTLTPFQLSGTYDLPPSQYAFYEYGGLFSAYLQQKYGMEKYKEFWQAMGTSFRFSFNVYNSGLYHLFNETYNISFMEAWSDFLNTIAIDNITENPNSIPFTSKPSFIQSRYSFINVLSASKDTLYFGNELDRELLRYNPDSKTIEKVMGMDFSVYDMSVSSDGNTMLLSSYRYKGSLASAIATEYNSSNGGKTGRQWEDIYRVQYFRDGVIGINADLHNNNIVYRNFSGNEEILLRGTEEIMYTTPFAVNETWIVYVRSVNGIRELCMFNYETKKEYMLKSALEDDDLRWKYIRNLRVSNGRIMFVYNHDDRMYKLGVIDISQFEDEDSVMNAVFHSADFSGGVFLPVHIEGDIFYRGFFSDHDKLMRFPETLDSLSGTKTEIYLVQNETETLPGFSPEEHSNITNNTYESKNYFGLAYMNPLDFWLPMPLIRPTESFFSIDGLGIMSLMMDPTDTNMLTLTALGDWKFKMANAAIDWSTYYFGFPLDVSFSDGVNIIDNDRVYRQTQASISGAFTKSIGNEQNYLSAVGGIFFSLNALNPLNNSSAYTWSYDNPEFSAVLGLGWSTLNRYAWQTFGTGTNINLYYRTPFNISDTRLDAVMSIALEQFFPLRFQFYGTYDTQGMNIHGNSKHYDSYFGDTASIEYPSPRGLDVDWLGGVQTDFKLFNFEIQKNLSHIYFNRIYSTLSYRAVVYDSYGAANAEGTHLSDNILLAQSLILRLELESTIIPVKSAPIILIPNMWGAWKISNMNDGKTNDFHFNVGFDFSF